MPAVPRDCYSRIVAADSFFESAKQRSAVFDCPKKSPKYEPLNGDVEMEARIRIDSDQQVRKCFERLQDLDVLGTNVCEREDMMFFDPQTRCQHSVTAKPNDSIGVRSKSEGERIIHDGISILVREEVSLRNGEEGFAEKMFGILESAQHWEKLGRMEKQCVDVLFGIRDAVFCLTVSSVKDRTSKQELHQIELEMKGLLRAYKSLVPEDLLAMFSEAFSATFGKRGHELQDPRTKLSWLSQLRRRQPGTSPHQHPVSAEQSELLGVACSA